MADKQGRFVILDTTLAKTDATLIDELSGRQGDNGRVVYFALKDGQFPHDLTGQDVQLEVKDSAGKVKVIHGINERVSDEGGLFNLIIPAEVYQASGDVQEAYLAVVDDKGVKIASIPIAFTVFENGIIISANASQDYLSSVDKMIADAYKKIDDLTAYYDTLNDKIDDLTNVVNKNQVALLNSDNTFSKSLIVKGGITADLHGTADKAKSASDSDNFAGHSYEDALGHEAFRRGTRFFAHRGAQVIAPENSLPALKKVNNHSGYEIDIHQTSDGRWVVMHDGNIDRMTSKKGAISSYTFDQLRNIPISKGSSAGRYMASELVIPSLEEALIVAKDKRLTPVIEIKKDSTDNYTSASYDSLVAIIKKFNVEKEMMFISFDYNSLVEVKKRLPLVEVSYLTSDFTQDLIDKAVALGVNSGIDADYTNSHFNARNVQLAHDAGLKVGAWTTADDSKRDALLAMGVDFITTNSLSGELRYAELKLQNGWKNNSGQTALFSYVTEIAPGKILVRFSIYGGNRTHRTIIANLPDWASPNSEVWSPAVLRTASNIVLGSFDIAHQNSDYVNQSSVSVGINWDSINNADPFYWVSGEVVYYV
ncbi:glycerophosphodiester phosphodiesterase family protein [Weissella hellenica]|uniref:glycerophosphodiester phosphodiesterase family protein n=1 Tax=Weissella hellenica TaxID=46256 RepID=UPI00388B8D14